MPKLLLFAPCERVIIDDQGSATLVIILHKIAVFNPKIEELPKDAVAPKEWVVFTLWEPMAEDIGKEFVQVLQTILPDGSEFKKSEMRFRFQEGKRQQNRMLIQGMPVGQDGKLALNTWLEVDSRQVGEVNSYDLTITYSKEDPSIH